jgi:YesN/AraC family two-component response regulator
MAKILVIDDELPIAVMIKRMLEKENHEVLTALNGKDGLDIANSFSPDIVVTDIVMPEKEGLELIFTLKKTKPEIRIVAISGGGRFNYEGYLTTARHLGADRTLVKPLDHKGFIAAINELL